MSSPARVLIVDDDPDTREIVALGVTSMGLEARGATDGEAALGEFQEWKPDLIVLDLMMPGMTGNEVCSRIRRDETGQYVPIIMLTACDTLRDKMEAFEDGADDYLTKPFQMQELQARIKAMLRIRSLNLKLQQQNGRLLDMQNKLIEQERKLLVVQLAGTAAHKLGQPLSAIMLNSHLLRKLPASDERFSQAIEAIKQDSKRMAEMLEKLKSADAGKTEAYYKNTEILEIE